jgi:hypothetical protein
MPQLDDSSEIGAVERRCGDLHVQRRNHPDRTITIAADTAIGAGGQAITLSGGGTVRLFKANSGVTHTLDRITVADGANSAICIGTRAAAIVGNSTFTANSAPSGGAA